MNFQTHSEIRRETRFIESTVYLLQSPLSDDEAVVAPRLLKPLANGASETRDPMIEVLLPASSLVKLKLVSGSWAAISLEKKKRWNLCRLIVANRNSFPTQAKDGEDWIMIPPGLSFNIGIHPFKSKALVTSILHRGTINEDYLSYQSDLFFPSLASEALIARVHTCVPANMDPDIFYMKVSHEMISLALGIYMSSPKVLFTNDVFGVPFPKIGLNFDVSEATESDFINAIRSNGSELFWFKVISLNKKIEPRDCGIASTLISADTAMGEKSESLSTGNFERCSDLYSFISQNSAVVHRYNTTLMQSKAVSSGFPNYRTYHHFVAQAMGYPVLLSSKLNDAKNVEKIVDFFSPFLFDDSDVSESSLANRSGSVGSLLLCGPRGAGKLRCIEEAASSLGMHVQVVTALSVMETVEALIDAAHRAIQCRPAVLVIRNLCASFKTGRQAMSYDERDDVVAMAIQKTIRECFRSATVIVAATCENLDIVPAMQKRCFTHTFEIGLPDLSHRSALLSSFLKSGPMRAARISQENINEMAKKTEGRTAREIQSLVFKAFLHARRRRNSCGIAFSLEHFRIAHSAEQVAFSYEDLVAGEAALLPLNSSGVVKKTSIPSVKWDDVGGLASIKNEIIDIIELPLKHPKIFASGVKRRTGILLYGPPGTGKTLLAKAVANECGLSFFSVKGPELLDMYVGESERNVRNVFKSARSSAPCVLFFDELDSLAPQRGRGADSGGVMDRVVAQLLAELDGVTSSDASLNIFVIGATNRPDLLDPSLLRPGRFDRLLYLGTGGDPSSQLKVLRAATRQFTFEDDVDLEEISRSIPWTFTGADISAVASASLTLALKRRITDVEERAVLLGVPVHQILNAMGDEELTVRVSRDDLEKAARSIRPSVSQQELMHYETLRRRFSSDRRQTNGTDS